jgi:hypothetical protein
VPLPKKPQGIRRPLEKSFAAEDNGEMNACIVFLEKNGKNQAF